MSETMRAVVLDKPGRVRVEEIPRPVIQSPTDAIVRVTTAAICGSDLHLIDRKIPGMEEGDVVGHEFVGVIEDIGDAVMTMEPGQRVVASMFPACGHCRSCMRHQYRTCPSFQIFGSGPGFGDLLGAQTDFVRVPLADMTLATIPDRMSDEDAVFTGDILATAYQGLADGGVRHGDSVAIVGAGPVGQLAVMCAPLFGVDQVFAIDLVPERLEAAKGLGAIPVDARLGDPSDSIFDQTRNLGADVVLEAVGNEAALETAWSVVRTGGTVAMIGVLYDEDWPVSAGDNWLRAVTVKPIVGDPLTHRHDLLRLIETGKLDPARIISHTMSLDDAADAYQMFKEHRANKVVLKTGEE